MNTARPTPLPAAFALPPVGVEWVVEAFGSDPDRLRSDARLRDVCELLLIDLALTPVADPLWHRFPGPGGITGLFLLAESHLACHTYPEYGLATFNLYCCKPRPRWPWEARLTEALSAGHVLVREVPRGVAPPEAGS